MIQKIIEGSATRVIVIIKDKEVEFKLALFNNTSWSFTGAVAYEYGFISNNNQYFNSLYSGGNTGCGVSDYNILKLPEHMKFITTDITQMIEIAEEQENKAKKQKENFEKLQFDKIKRINALPEKFEIKEIPELIFNRSEAEFRSSYSRLIQGGQINLTLKNGDTVYYHNWVTSDGKLRTKNFTAYMPQIFGKVKAAELDPKETLRKIIDRKKEIKKIIETIQYKRKEVIQ